MRTRRRAEHDKRSSGGFPLGDVAKTAAHGPARGGLARPALAPPGPDDHAGVARAVEQVVPLLALAGGTAAHHDRALRDAVALEDRADEELRGLVLHLLLAHGRGELRAHRAIAARRVRDVRAGEHAHERGEDVHTGLAEAVVG